ncbi:MAG: lysylphosphatidylglycerol synthase transmembrane domain-containing protein [Bacteroidales bacterium]|nr:lysylphosphatidylglycerol synthase transmembrane domain-containing protein [Bacteroidales bacterium]
MKEFVDTSIQNAAPKENKASLWRNIAFILGLSVLVFMIYKIGIDQIWNNIKSVGPWFALIIGVWGVVYIINTIAWYSIIKSENAYVPFFKVMKFTISGYALNYVTPMGLAGGEPYRIMELRRYIGTERATASVILYAMMHVCSHFFFWLSAAMLVAWTVKASPMLSIILTCIVATSLVLIFIFFRGYRKGLVVKLFRLLSKVPFLKKKINNLSPETKAKVELIDEEIKNLHGTRKKSFYFSLGMEFLARLVSCLEIYFIVMALGYDITYIQSLIVVGLSSLFANILFFSPMQLGTREGGIALAFSTIGLVSGLGVSVSMITRIRELFWIMLGMIIMKINSDK